MINRQPLESLASRVISARANSPLGGGRDRITDTIALIRWRRHVYPDDKSQQKGCAMPAYDTIEVDSLFQHSQNGGVELVDVRTPAEFREIHVPFALNKPLDALDVKRLAGDADGKPLYVICKSGQRASMACKKINAEGGRAAVCVVGGTIAWEQAGFEVNRGKKAVSLERQVRIAAGTLVLTGVTLAAIVHPWWIAFSGFVGAGLIFAGVTDTCVMGMLLARMPWNQVAGTPADSAACSLPKTKTN